MTWVDPTARQTGDLITAAIWNQDVVDNSQFLYDSALGSVEYDSGWFAVTYNTAYTKAHGFGQAPRFVAIWHSTTASPGSADELVMALGGYEASVHHRNTVGVDSTNIYIQTATSNASGVCDSTRRASASGYYRVLAWK